jgi:hypothetical protein
VKELSMIKNIHRIAAIGAIGAGLALAAAAPAGAATGPTVASVQQAGFTATGAQFRYVQESFTLPNAAKFASEIGGFGLSVHLWSAHSVVVLGVSNSTTAGNFNAAAAVFNPVTQATVCSTAGSGTRLCAGTPTNWTDGSVSFAPGDFLTESIFYSQGAGTIEFTVIDQTSGQSLTYTRNAGKGISWNQARVGAEFGCTPWASCGTGPVPYNAPSDPVTLASFSGIRLTTYSGHRAGVSSWWTHSKIEWTRNGKTTGAVNAKASNLSGTGTVFSVSLEP